MLCFIRGFQKYRKTRSNYDDYWQNLEFYLLTPRSAKRINFILGTLTAVVLGKNIIPSSRSINVVYKE